MRFLVALGLLAAAFASQNWETRPEKIYDQVFKSGKQYNFKFDGQIASGLPLPSSSNSASRIESLLSLNFESDRHVLFKINKIRVGSAQRELVESREVQPFELFEEIELTEEQKENFLLPVRFRYENGLISEIEFDREEPTWSANMKRAILNMIQLNLSKKSRTDSEDKSLLMRDSYEKEWEEKEWEEKIFFSTQEKTLEGDCETSYTVVPTGEEKRLHVSKSINFEKCKKRVDIRYNLRFGEACPSCENKFNREEANTQSSTVVEFELNGTPEEHLIREVRLRSQYVFTPVSGEEQLMATVVSNKLTLLSLEEGIKIRGPKSEKKEEIVYSTEWEERLEKFRMTGEESLIKNSPYHWMNKKMELAEKTIETIRHHLEKSKKDESLKSETVHEMARLIEILRVMTTREVEKLEKMIEKKEEKLSALFYDALAQAGTYPCIYRLIEGITARRLSTVQTVTSLKMLFNTKYPSDKMVHDLLRFAREDFARTPVVRQSLWLSIGAVMNGVCGENTEKFAVEMKKEEMCPRELKEKYVREMETLLEKADSHYEKILALKVFANAGIDLAVYPIEKIIKDRKEQESVRLTAIESLRKLTRVMHRKIQSILLPLYKKTSESVEIRVAAFHHLMHTQPSREIIDQITLHLNKEPSTRMHSYVLSALKSFASSEIPCEKDLARDIEQSLKFVRLQSSRLDSRTSRASYYSHEYLSGSDLIWSHLASNESTIPSEISASLTTLFGGEWYSHMAEIGFSQENIHVLISKLYKVVKENEDSIEEIMVRGKRSSEMRPLESLKALMKKMGIQERRSNSAHSAAVVYMRLRDMDYVFVPLEEKILVDAFKMLLKTGASDLASLEKVLARGYSVSGLVGSFVYEKTRVIPTTIGMPLDITWKMPTIVSVEGEVRASVEERSLSVSLRPKLATTHVVQCETRSPIFSQGVKLVHSLNLLTPIEADLKMETTSRSVFSLNFRLPEETDSMRVMRVQTRPVTYIRLENNKEKYANAVEKTTYLQREPREEINSFYGEKALGVRFAVRGNIHRNLVEKIENGVTPIFVGENDLEVRMEKTETTPREYTIRLSVDSIDKKEKMTEDIELDSFYPSEHSHFSVHDDVTVEKSRRSEFSEYLRALSSKPVFTHRLHMTLETRGSSVERRATGELRTMCDESLSYCKWTASVSRSPLLKGEDRDWELVSTLQTLLPSRMVSVKEMKGQKHREILAKLNTKWGSDEKKTVTLRVQMDQSPEYIKYVERLVEKKQIDSVEKATRLNQLKISADYRLNEESLVQFSRLSTLIKGLYPVSCEIETRDETERSPKEGRLLAKLTVEPQTWRYANFSMETPRERLRLSSIRLPFRPTWFTLEKKAPMLRSFSPVCEVSDSRMQTFDEIIYRAPLTTCYSVLAKDCSEEPKFAVLVKKNSKNGEEKKLKMITRENTIEIEMNKYEMEVSVDGKIVKEKKMEEYGLEKRGDVVIFENEDIFVKFDGYETKIKLNELYKAKQCGLCGHFDGEKKGEFRKADDEETEDLEEFHRSFLLKSDECEMDEERIKEKKNYKKFEDQEDSEEWKEDENESEKKEKKEKKEYNFEKEDDESVDPIEKTRVIEYSNRVCFSKTPVPECPKKTIEKEEETKKVHFTCLDRSSSEARRLLRESHREILSIDDFPNSFVESVSVPKYCVVY